MKKFLMLLIIAAMVFAVTACATAKEEPAASASAQSSASATPAGDATAGPEVLRDVRVRQALSLAIDRDYLNETVWNGTREPAYAICPGGIHDATPASDFRETGGDLMPADFEKNVAEAQRLLAEAGFPNGEGFPILELAYNTNPRYQAVGEVLQRMWRDNLGIRIKLAAMDWDVYMGYRNTNDCQLARQEWSGDYCDPSMFFDLFTSDAGTNDGHYSNAEYDRLVKAADAERDPAARMQMYHDAETIFMNDMGCIPLVFYADDVLSQTGFTGYTVMGTGLKTFWEASKDPTICLGPHPQTLDPTINKSVDGMIYITHMYEGIYRPDTDGSFSYGQAESVTVEGTTVTVKLRDDIFWSDGQPVTADNFIYSWRRLCDPNAASQYNYLAGDLFANGWDVINGVVPPDQLDVTKVSDKEFTFEITANVPYLQDLLAFPNFMPLREDVVTAGGDEWAAAADFPTNGRYTVSELAGEDRIVLSKNDAYWDAESTLVSKITFRLMSDDNAILAAFDAGELDFADSLPADKLAALRTTPEYHRFPNLGIYYIQINNTAQ